MTCDEFKDALDALDSPSEMSEQMRRHAASCEECRQYAAAIEALTPARVPEMPAAVKQAVLRKIQRRERLQNFFRPSGNFMRVAASVACVALIVVVALFSFAPTPVRAAEKLLDGAIAAASHVKSMCMTVDVRTTSYENFAYISLDDSMVEHTLTVDFNTPKKWRLEKLGRGIVFDGKNAYLWSVGDPAGLKSTTYGFAEKFRLLLDPQMLLMQEKLTATEKYAKYNITEQGDDIVMTATVEAQGEFHDGYGRNTSVAESNTRRELRFDKQTKLLQSLKIWAIDGAREVLVVDVSKVKYDIPVDDAALTALPEGYEWIDADAADAAPSQFSGISLDAAVKLLADAINSNNIASVADFFPYDNIEVIEQVCDGMRVLSVGKPFHSGLYSGWFVPYAVQLPDGNTKKGNLAIRNDNPTQKWEFDGGF